MMRAILSLAALLALSACGVRADLKPLAGMTLPATPYGRAEPLSSREMLQPPVQAAPERNVELRKRSEERDDDPFDLPPAEATRR